MALGCYDILERVCISLMRMEGDGWGGGRLAVWQIPEYFISIRSSSGRNFVSVMGISLKPAFEDSTTRASVSRGRVAMIAESFWI